MLMSIFWLMVEHFHLLENSGLSNLVIDNLIYLSHLALSSVGFSIFTFNTIVGIEGTSGVSIGSPCNALDLMALFMGILYVLPGKTKEKIIYSLIGIVLIHLLNLIRVIILILIIKIHPSWLEFNHNYTFTLIMYTLIFLTWVNWMKRQKKYKSE